MTELETRLMDALAALSAQWKADQDQQAFEKSELDPRLQELAQQVTDFAQQHEQQAGALQAQLQHLDTQVGLLTTQYDSIAADYKAPTCCRRSEPDPAAHRATPAGAGRPEPLVSHARLGGLVQTTGGCSARSVTRHGLRPKRWRPWPTSKRASGSGSPASPW